MQLTTILSVLSMLGPFIEPALNQLESGTIQPELQGLIAQVTNPELKNLLTAIDTAFDSFVKQEIGSNGITVSNYQ